MATLLLSDIHPNATALTAVLDAETDGDRLRGPIGISIR